MSLPKASNIIMHELIGLEVEVLSDSNPCNHQIKGVVIDETMNTLIIKDRQAKQIAKKNAIFKFKLHNEAVKVEGHTLLARPEDRVKKTIKRRW